MNHDQDLDELDRIWPLGRLLDVPSNGTVLVAGAYQGRFMHYVLSRYEPRMVVGYEPQEDARVIARMRLTSRPRPETSAFAIEPMGIGVHDCLVKLQITGSDGCHVGDFIGDKEARLVGFGNIVKKWGKFDLFICNMEGYETFLIPYLCASNLISTVQSLAIQFHDGVKDRVLVDQLSEHYGEPIYNDFPTWCFWRKEPC